MGIHREELDLRPPLSFAWTQPKEDGVFTILAHGEVRSRNSLSKCANTNNEFASRDLRTRRGCRQACSTAPLRPAPAAQKMRSLFCCAFVAAVTAQTNPALVTIEAGGKIVIGTGGVLSIGAAADASAEDIANFLAKVGVSTIDDMESMATLDWSSKGLSDADCTIGAQILGSDGADFVATTFNISGNDFTDACATELATAFTAGALPSLTTIDADDTDMTSSGLAAITSSPFVSLDEGDDTTNSRRLAEADEDEADQLSNSSRSRRNAALSRVRWLRFSNKRRRSGGSRGRRGDDDDDEGFRRWGLSLIDGALPNMTKLRLRRAGLRNKGMMPLADAMSQGTMDAVEEVSALRVPPTTSSLPSLPSSLTSTSAQRVRRCSSPAVDDSSTSPTMIWARTARSHSPTPSRRAGCSR